MQKPRPSQAPGRGLSEHLQAYLVVISVAGPVLALSVALLNPIVPSHDEWVSFGMLAGMAFLGVLLPLRVRQQTLINVVGAAYLALIFVSPVGLPGLLAFGIGLAGRLIRRQTDPLEIAFNAGQTAFYVTVGALVFHAASAASWPGPRIEGIGPLEAVLLTALVVYLTNFTLVTLAVAFQVGASPVRVWRKNVGRDFLTEATLFAIGVLAALLAVTYPLALPVLMLPVLLVHRSLRHTTRVQLDVERALAHLVELLEQRDAYTAGHSERVAIIARVLALRLGLTGDEASQIENAGRVHDIGKLVVDPGILRKTGPLTEAEKADMRLHPVHGASIVSRFSPKGDGHHIVRHHHERWDGSGYPDQLSEDQIPFGARILAVADSFDALNSDRSYRRAVDPRHIREIMRDGAGSQWDPYVVDALLGWLYESGRLRDENGRRFDAASASDSA